MALDIMARADVGDCYRSFDFTECEFRDDGPDGFVTFEGIASVVDKPYQVRDQWGTFTETILKGAFDKSLAELNNRAKKAKDDRGAYPDAALFINHQRTALPLATVKSGRLHFSATPDLHVRAFLNPARPSVQEVRHAVDDGDATEMSVGMSVPKARDKWAPDMSERWISEAGLKESSIVWQGANPYTGGAMRSLADLFASLTDVDMDEDELRRAIAALEARLNPTDLEPSPDVVAQLAEFAKRDREDRDRLARQIASAPDITSLL